VGRVSYSYANRYFVTGSMRRDYAGRLPEGKKYGDFPSVTAAWKLSEEPFMPKTKALNLLKFRGSWGRIGNLGSIANAYGNPAITEYANQYDVAGSLGRGAMLTTAFNPYLTWETSEQTDFGLDADFLNSRLSVSVDWFDKRTFNLIKQQELNWPTYVGLGAKTINEGEIRNRGWEFSLGWNDQINKDWSYFVNANFSTLKNWVSNIGSADPVTGAKPVWRGTDSYRSTVLTPFRTIEGEPLNSYWLVQSAGLFQSDAEAAAYVDKDGNRIQPNAIAGDLKFIDQLTVDTNDDGIPDAADGRINDDDRVQMGAYFPKTTYAVTAGFTWKDLSFSFMLQGVGGIKLFNGWKYTLLSDADMNVNRSQEILNAWSPTNTSSTIPRLTSVDSNSNFGTTSDWYLEDASYLRIKNINLAYSLDKALASITPFLQERKSSLLLYMSIDNLFTFTKYSGMDPEIGGAGLDRGRYPLARIVSFGIKLTY
jgi:TonB-linked SusC/RagA family outer membrane protein